MMIGFVGMIIVITPQKILRRTVEEKFQFLNKENLSPQCLHTLDIVRHKPTLLKRITLDTTLSLPFFPASSVIDLYSDGPEISALRTSRHSTLLSVWQWKIFFGRNFRATRRVMSCLCL